MDGWIKCSGDSEHKAAQAAVVRGFRALRGTRHMSVSVVSPECSGQVAVSVSEAMYVLACAFLVSVSCSFAVVVLAAVPICSLVPGTCGTGETRERRRTRGPV